MLVNCGEGANIIKSENNKVRNVKNLLQQENFINGDKVEVNSEIN